MAKKKEAVTDLREKAKKIADAHTVSVVYANSKGEFFTVYNYALLSVDNQKDKLKTFDFGNDADIEAEAEETDSGDE